MRHRWTCSPAALVLVAVTLAVPAGAEVRIWDHQAGNRYWSNPDNWLPTGYAESDDLIVLSGSGLLDTNASVTTDNGGSISLNGCRARFVVSPWSIT